VWFFFFFFFFGEQELRASSAEDGKAPPAAEADSKEVYKGMSGYKQYVQKGAPDRTAGPIRATQHVRMSTHMDYAPDICKDYKETGYCGYGDKYVVFWVKSLLWLQRALHPTYVSPLTAFSFFYIRSCKFMHDRGDYKTGWQIDRDWEAAQKSKRKALVSGKAEEDEDWTVKDEDDGLPFACFICRQPFTDPVVTKCGHYFCEDCALNHHKKSHKCAVCKEPTMGIFNTAAKIMKKRDEIAKAKADAEREEEERLRAETAYRSSNASSGGRSEHHFEQGEDAPAVVDD
jgi:RING finger protein 113A